MQIGATEITIVIAIITAAWTYNSYIHKKIEERVLESNFKLHVELIESKLESIKTDQERIINQLEALTNLNIKKEVIK